MRGEAKGGSCARGVNVRTTHATADMVEVSGARTGLGQNALTPLPSWLNQSSLLS